MSLIDGLRYRVRALFGAGRHARETERELRFHLDLEAAQRRHEGVAPDDAEFAARRQLGNRTAVAEAMRRVAGLGWLDTTRQDVAFALRGIRRAPGFATIAAATLALGIGSATAIYAVIDTVLLRPLPIAHPDRVVDLELVMQQSAGPGAPEVLWVSIPEFLRWRERLHSFSGLALARPTATVPLGPHTSDDHSWWLSKRLSVRTTAVTPNFFTVLGTAPFIGRGFNPGAPIGTSAGTALISYAYWQRAYGGDPRAIGRTIQLDGQTYAITGVMQRGFVYPQDTQVWTAGIPKITGFRDNEYTFGLDVIGRLRDAVAPAGALAELQTVFASDTLAQLALRGKRVAAPTLRDAVLEQSSTHLIVMTAFVGVLLLIAAANVINMLFVRGTARRHEIAIRLALGASRGRIVRQLVTEAVLLATLGALAGLVAAAAIARFVAGEPALNLPRRSLISVDASVLIATAIGAAAVGLVCGLIPALSVSRDAVESTLRSETTRHSAGRGRGRMRDGIVVGQIALSVVLLAGAGLLVQTFRHMMEISPGLSADGLLTGDLELGYPEADTVARALAAGRIGDRLRSVPNVADASIATTYPFGDALSYRMVRVPGRATPDSTTDYTQLIGADLHYFTTLHLRIVRGRSLTAQDMTRRDVAIVNYALAQKFFPSVDPIGQHFFVSEHRIELEIVGVVESTRSTARSSAPEPATYVPLAAAGAADLAVIVRVTHGDPAGMVSDIRRATVDAAPGSRVFGLGPLDALLRYLAGAPHAYMMLLVTFALAALLVTAVGLYGVISYSVAQRTREIGIRIALGASPNTVGRRVARHGLGLTMVGVAAGAAAAVVATRVLRNMLYGVAPGDPSVLAIVAVLLVAIALVASWLPARRAAAVDPLVAIRTE